MTGGRAPLVSVPPGASGARSDRGPGGVPLIEEVAAIVAVVAVLEAEQAAAAVAAAAAQEPGGQLHAWVQSSRVSARGGTFTRGSWRLAGRLARRARA